MYEKRIKTKGLNFGFLIVFIVLLLVPFNVCASNYDYVINKYHVDINVNENNILSITETIDVYFDTYKHGIFRKIPLKNEIIRLDGTTSKNRVKISDINVNEEYSLSTENGYKVIKIGSPNYTVTGNKTYKISYLYNLGKDRGKNYDELYFNIIGTEWDTEIRNITFSITMPKSFDASKLGFSSGIQGSTNANDVIYNVDGNVISGYLTRQLNAREGLTVRLELPEGYFANAGIPIDFKMVLFFLIPILSLILAIYLWYKYGKDDLVVGTVEFYPPEGLNSLEVALLYKGKAEGEDVTSLLIYLANKGYLKITEKEEKKLFGGTADFIIEKVKDYDGDNEQERMFLEGLFRKKDKVTKKDLYNKFYTVQNKILNSINSKRNKNKIFNSINSKKSILIIIPMILSIITIITIPTLEYAGTEELVMSLIVVVFYIPFYAVGLSNSMPKAGRIFWLGFTILHSSVFFFTMPAIDAVREESVFSIGFLIGIICIIGMIICLKLLPKRTPYGNEMLGKISGFKNFLETTEKEKLEVMVMQDPLYFYNILPYTYVLGISDRWINKFESINLQEPDWYSGNTNFNTYNFGRFIDKTMNSASSAMRSSPSSSGGSSSSGGFSGGGSSGGGSGGGGGGSW